MKILSVVSEYPPFGSGLSQSTKTCNLMLEEMGHTVDVWHPESQGQNGILSLARWWEKVAKRLETAHYDLVFFHQPNFPRTFKVNSPVLACYHVSYQGKAKAFGKWFTDSWERRYYQVAAAFEKRGLDNLMRSCPQITVIANTKTVGQELGLEIEAVPFHLGAGGLPIPENRHGIAWVGRDAKTKNKRLAQRMKLPITFISGLPHEKAMALLNQHMFILNTSIYDALPNSLLEGISLGLYPVVSNIPSLREVIQNVRAGCVFELESPADAQEALVRASEARAVPDFTYYSKAASFERLKKCVEASA